MEKIQELSLEERLNKDVYNLMMMAKKCKSTKRYEIILNDIMCYQQFMDELGIDIFDVFDYTYMAPSYDFSESMKYYKEHKKTIEFDKLLVEGFEIIDKNKFIYYDDILLKDIIKFEKSCEYSLDFLEQYDKNMYNLLIKIFNENRIVIDNNITTREYVLNGITMCGVTYYSPYIKLILENNLIDSATIIHELGHVYVHNKFKSQNISRNSRAVDNDYQEVYSFFIELLFYDYLEDEDINKNDLLEIRRKYDQILIDHNIYIGDIIEDINVKDFAKNFGDYQDSYSYARGLLLAYYFYDMYQEDREKAMYNIDNFLLDSCKYDFLDLINRNGLNRERIESLDVPKKYIKSHFEY